MATFNSPSECSASGNALKTVDILPFCGLPVLTGPITEKPIHFIPELLGSRHADPKPPQGPMERLVAMIEGAYMDSFQKLHRVVIRGPGICGQSDLACRFAIANKQQYDAIFLFQSCSKDGLSSKHADLMWKKLRLGMSGQEEAARRWLEWPLVQNGDAAPKLLKTLWVFDGLEDEDDLENFWPYRGHGTVLVTTDTKKTPVFKRKDMALCDALTLTLEGPTANAPATSPAKRQASRTAHADAPGISSADAQGTSTANAPPNHPHPQLSNSRFAPVVASLAPQHPGRIPPKVQCPAPPNTPGPLRTQDGSTTNTVGKTGQTQNRKRRQGQTFGREEQDEDIQHQGFPDGCQPGPRSGPRRKRNGA